MKNNISARALIRQGDEFVFLQNKRFTPAYYVLPGGHIDQGEGAIAAVIREIAEELAYEFPPEAAQFLGPYEQIFNSRFGMMYDLSLIFLLKFTADKKAICCRESGLEPLWLTFEQIKERQFKPYNLLQLLEIWLTKPGNFGSSISKNKGL